jgi:hypothetical protein
MNAGTCSHREPLKNTPDDVAADDNQKESYDG